MRSKKSEEANDYESIWFAHNGLREHNPLGGTVARRL